MTAGRALLRLCRFSSTGYVPCTRLPTKAHAEVPAWLHASAVLTFIAPLTGCANTELGMGILIDVTRAVDAVCRWCLP